MEQKEIDRIIATMPEPFKSVIQMDNFSIDYKTRECVDHTFLNKRGYDLIFGADCSYYVRGLSGINPSSYGDWGTIRDLGKNTEALGLFLEMYEKGLVELWRIRIYLPNEKGKKQQYEYTDKDGWSTYDINQKKWIKTEQPFLI